MNNSRYIVQKLIDSDLSLNLEIWKNTTVSSNNIDSLVNFISEGYRVFDLEENVIVLKNQNQKMN